jgi:hypothetical protein
VSYDVDATYGCWLWTGRTDSRDGRPLVWRGRTPVQAHIVVYREHEGDVPTGLVLDHTCARPSCVAPHHMEPVTQRENMFRKQWRYRSRIERCKNGHDMRLFAMPIPDTGGRVCRMCNQIANDGVGVR